MIKVGDIGVTAVPAYNLGKPFHARDRKWVGYMIQADGLRIYHAGDTDFIPEMRNLRNIYLALLPSGGTYTMDNPEAAEAALAIRPEFVIPMHRWKTDPNEFKKDVEAKSKIKVILLKPGEEFKAE
jgi:L-ascorbate metabolism protein UlaG (beta-lactamase superfamily)